MKIFLTGGAGYIGSITSHLLIQGGHSVTIYDDLSSGHLSAVPVDAEFIEGDILDSQKLNKSMGNFDAVLHFAGRAIVSESFEKEKEYLDINVSGSANVIASTVANGIKKLVASSSCAVYGSSYFTPISETFEKVPINPYGFSKLEMDRLISKSVGDNRGFGAISLRFFNVAGSLKLGNKWIGEDHEPETHVIPNLITATKDRPFKLYGNNYSTPDGTCVRDFVHVVDIARAHILALEKVSEGTHEIYNLGSSAGHSLLDLIQMATSVLGKQIPIEIVEKRPGDPDLLVADNTKARAMLGWEPEFGLRRMIQDTLDFKKVTPLNI
jgi:UDP-glucose 4-epimerase